MNYSPLVMITLKHAFYESGRCPDFAVIPNPDTSKLFKNHRCIVKSNVYGLSVYVPVENQHPLIRFADDSRLFFDLRLQNDEFALYTDQRMECSDPAALQFYQEGTSVKPGQDILTAAKVNEVLLSVAIQRDFNQINAIHGDEVRFFAKPVLWFYYVVTDPGNSEQLAIVDASQEAAKTTTWQRHTSLEGDSIYTQLIKQYPAMAVICFVSEQTLDCHESCSRHLQLKLGDHVVFDQLPSPGYQNYFHLGPKTDTKPTDAIYEIVKYFSNTTLIKG